MQEPKVLMIDELSLGLSPLLAQQLFLTLKKLKQEGITIVLVEQNVHLALALADYAYVMAEGRVRLEGPRDVPSNPPVRAGQSLRFPARCSRCWAKSRTHTATPHR